jgi:hypothetical protein
MYTKDISYGYEGILKQVQDDGVIFRMTLLLRVLDRVLKGVNYWRQSDKNPKE